MPTFRFEDWNTDGAGVPFYTKVYADDRLVAVLTPPAEGVAPKGLWQVDYDRAETLSRELEAAVERELLRRRSPTPRFVLSPSPNWHWNDLPSARCLAVAAAPSGSSTPE